MRQQLGQRLRQLGQKTTGLRNPRVYFLQPSATRTSPGGRNRSLVETKNTKLYRTLWTSNIAKNSRRSQDGPATVFRRHPRSLDSVCAGRALSLPMADRATERSTFALSNSIFWLN